MGLAFTPFLSFIRRTSGDQPLVRLVILAGISVTAALDDLEVRVKQERGRGLISSHESLHFDNLGLNRRRDVTC